ncbi:hypothetical protein [Halorarum halobium]|uniref:hypothetical protein n=1 Tax=Halorarum halobium TaxID=3075121 RepID=UPI0028A63611|nr:hypothetical protein [Halobaculum sp. XH14]
MSEWKYVRKKNLRNFEGYNLAAGILVGLGVGALLDVIGGYGSIGPVLFIFAMSIGFWYVHRDEFTRIRKAIDDAGGDNQS